MEKEPKEELYMKIMECKHCKNQTLVLNDSGAPMVCCGEPMNELIAGSVDAAAEKHVPAVTVDGSVIHVAVGDVIHPMTEAHYIKWIAAEQDGRIQYAPLTPEDEPKASFTINSGKFTVYEYCNLHGLWKAEGSL